MKYLCIIALVLLLASGCEDKIRPSMVPVRNEIPSQESWRSRVVFTDSARVNAILWAGHISVFQTGRYTLLDDSVHVDFFNERGEHSSILTARRGKVNDQTRDFEAYDSVVVVSDSGTTLKTDRLFWNNSDKTVHTDAFVDILSPTEHIMGQGMVSDQGLKNYKIFKVTGRAALKE
jgi:LPS export ABC transporter protein LptC